MSLEKYKEKRDFKLSSEPPAKVQRSRQKQLHFVVQRHAASRLHYDFRLEMDGVLKSWAIPKGPSLNPADKRLAVMVEDHPYAYRKFEGTIPKGNYGAGEVVIWDEGTYTALEKDKGKGAEALLLAGLKKGAIKFVLNGSRLQGAFALVKMKTGEDNAWLLIKHADDYAVHEVYNAETHPKTSKLKNKKPEPKATGKKKINRQPGAVLKDRFLLQQQRVEHAVKPMLAITKKEPFDDAAWIFEIKWDGYRAIAETGKITRLYSRTGISLVNKFTPLFNDLQLQRHKMVIDGEIVAYNTDGLPDFQELQHYNGTVTAVPLQYHVFDLLQLNGKDIAGLDLLDRKALLKEALVQTSCIRYCDHVAATGKAFFKAVQQKNMEGVMAKLSASKYQPGVRSAAWVKIKHHHTEDAIVIGFTEPQGSRSKFGALILALPGKEGALQFAGHVGTGFDEKTLDELFTLLQPLVTSRCPVPKVPKTNMPVTWVKPQIVVVIKFTHFTRQGLFRHPVFMGINIDKSYINPLPLKTNNAMKPGLKNTSPATNIKVGKMMVSLTNTDKMYWPAEGYTKGDMIEYYNTMYRYILPYLKNRPENLNRFPNGITGESFYHKDAGDNVPGWVDTSRLYSKSTKKYIDYIVCNNKATLLYLANLGCIELNPWNSRIQAIDYPTYLVLDLDPSEKNNFDEVIEVAKAVKQITDEIGATALCKTSGATGLHVYIPLGHKYHYDQVKDFAHLLALHVQRLLPELTTLERSLKTRGNNNIYVDYLQNRKGQTIASPYSLRPRPLATVSTPLHWKELKKGLHPEQFTITTLPRRINRMGDIFSEVLGKGIRLEQCLAALERL